MSFAHPALLFGALLFAVPLIIHLLNRQRYKKRQWAAMEFLLAAYRKQRRRLRTENLLLLLLRCLIPVLLALGIARPIFSDAVGPALQGSAHHVLVFDRSYSTGLRPEGAQAPYVRMRDLATELVDRLEGKTGSKITLVLAGARTEIPLADELNLARVKERIASLGPPPDSATDLTQALAQVAERFEDEDRLTMETAVYVFTDLQARALAEEDEDADPNAADPGANLGANPGAPSAEDFGDTARELLARIAEHAKPVLIDVGGSSREVGAARVDNVQIVDLKLSGTMAVARTPVRVVARLRNLSPTSRTVQVRLDLEGTEPTIESAAVEAGGEVDVEFAVVFRERGLRWVRAAIEGDGLAADDERFLVLDVRDQLRLLVVEGSDETDPDLMDAGHLWQVLDPEQGEGPPVLSTFGVKIIDRVELLAGREPLDDYDIVVLANVARLDARTATRLQDAMLGGTSLLVMLGDRVDAASYNLHLGQSGLMPMLLTEPRGYRPGSTRYYESEVLEPQHPILAEGFPEDLYLRAIEITPVYRLWGSQPLDGVEASILARARDPDLSPLLVAFPRPGAGKALYWTSAVSRRPDRWNRFDTAMLSFPLLHEAARWLALPVDDPHNVLAGVPLTASLPARPRDVAVLLPERAGGGKAPVGDTATQALPGGRHSLPAFRRTDHAGVYVVELQLESEGSVEPRRLPFAVNPDPIEGELVYLSHEEARERLGVSAVHRSLPTPGDAALPNARSDFGVPLLYLVLALLLGEAALARFVTRRRA
ncbi:MAG: BatA domain-containing protein [Planctomycetota bacterium]